MDNDITGVNQHPVACVQAFDAGTAEAFVLQVGDEVVADCRNMPVRAPGNHNHVVAQRRLAGNVYGDDIFGLGVLEACEDQLKSAAIVLGAVTEGKVSLIAGVTPDLVGKVKAGELVNFVAQQVGGKGGGRPDMAQAGGTDAAKLPGALASVKDWVEQRV